MSNLEFIKNILNGNLAAYEPSEVYFATSDTIISIADYLRSIGLLLDSSTMYLVANQYNKKGVQAFADEYNQDEDYE